MKQKLQTVMVALALVLGVSWFAATPAGAINVFDACTDATSDTEVCKGKDETIDSPIQTVIGILIFAIATISVIMIIVGGLRYVISNGDAAKIKSAKDTILYSVIGLVVSLLAYVIVNFVIGRFS